MPREVTLLVLLQSPPADVDYGLQKGSGHAYETVQTQRATGKDLQFSLTITVKGEPGKTAAPDFSGPFVQGKAQQRFFYIDVGHAAGQISSWSRRMKIPLTGITWELLAAAGDKPLKTSFAGTGRDGGPNCGTIKPFPGWSIGSHR